jgi:cyclopropane-fatty-acyl-phospholipid synthase
MLMIELVQALWGSPRVAMDRALADHRGTPFEFVFHTGERGRYGVGAPEFSVHFRTRGALIASLLETSLGFGEAWARGDVEIHDDLENVMSVLGALNLYERDSWRTRADAWVRHALARTLPREKADIEHHYGIGDDFYRFYLDKKLQYSCAYFRTSEDSLDQAQEQKIAHTLHKLDLRRGQRLLDVGCGWGHLMLEAAERWGVECVGLTLCDNQAAYIREQARLRRLPVEARVESYLEHRAQMPYDRVVSVGMMCHIGEARIEQFFDRIAAFLAPGAIGLLHCIAHMKETSAVDPFVAKHVFPGYWFNSLEGIVRRSVRRGFHVLDVENLRRHYALTAHHWRKNFLANRDAIKRRFGFDDYFLRIWEMYLAQVVAGFRIGSMHLVQVVISNGLQDDFPLTREHLYTNAERSTARLSA